MWPTFSTTWMPRSTQYRTCSPQSLRHAQYRAGQPWQLHGTAIFDDDRNAIRKVVGIHLGIGVAPLGKSLVGHFDKQSPFPARLPLTPPGGKYCISGTEMHA